MKIVLAPDSFKGSLSATAACQAMQRGVIQVLCNAQCIFVPLADGGEGTLEAILSGANGQEKFAQVHDPAGNLIDAKWGVLPGNRAVIEMAQASGLTLIPEEQRNALSASSFGTGELIKAALDFGCKELLIGIGGSATTDGGTGALTALGARFLDAHGQELAAGGAALSELHVIDLSQFDTRLATTRITVLCDVTNPLFGPDGAASVYGPQKGASPRDVAILDGALRRFSEVTQEKLGQDYSQIPGAGAAGGMGFALLAFCNAQLKSGIEVVLEAAQFSEKLKSADLVLTGEGALDAQTLSGKTIAGVCFEAGKQTVPVIAFGGKVSLTGEELSSLGLLSAFAIADAPLSLEDSIASADELLAHAVERVLRVWLAAR